MPSDTVRFSTVRYPLKLPTVDLVPRERVHVSFAPLTVLVLVLGQAFSALFRVATAAVAFAALGKKITVTPHWRYFGERVLFSLPRYEAPTVWPVKVYVLGLVRHGMERAEVVACTGPAILTEPGTSLEAGRVALA